jgi:hypothetical protein
MTSRPVNARSPHKTRQDRDKAVHNDGVNGCSRGLSGTAVHSTTRERAFKVPRITKDDVAIEATA